MRHRLSSEMIHAFLPAVRRNNAVRVFRAALFPFSGTYVRIRNGRFLSKVCPSVLLMIGSVVFSRSKNRNRFGMQLNRAACFNLLYIFVFTMALLLSEF